MKIKLSGKYVLPISSDPIYEGAVVIEDGRIKWLGKHSDLKEKDFDEEIGGDYIIMPGFVNSHTHAAMVAFRGLSDDLPLMDWLKKYIWPMENELVTAEFIKIAVALAASEMLLSGTTTFADMYFFQEEAAKTIESIGMRAVLAEGVIDYPTPSNPTPEKQLEYSEHFIKNWLNHPLIVPAVGPHAPYSTSPEILKKCKELSDRFDIPYLIHVSETREEVEQVRSKYGKTPVEHLNSIGILDSKVVAAHSIWLTRKEIDLYLERNVGVAHCPESNMKLASGVAPVSEYLKLGIKVGLATDGACSNNDLDMIGEMRSAALLHKVTTNDPTVLKAEEIVKMATLGSAKVLGLDDRIGSIEPGKEADLIMIAIDAPHMKPIYNPYSHLVYAAKASDVMHVFVKGNQLVKYGELQTIDYEKVLEELENKIVRKIKKHFGIE